MSADGSLGGQPPRRERPWLALSVVASLVLIAANAGVYLLYRLNRGEENSLTELALRQREAGIEAMRQERYEHALLLFDAAARLDPSLPNLDALTDVARRMTEDGADSAPPEPKGEGLEAVVESPALPAPELEEAPRSPPRPRVRQSNPPRREDSSRAATAELFVSTEPANLLVRVDGRAAGMSPTRLELPPGKHRVELRRGGETLYEGSINLVGGEPGVLEFKTPARATGDDTRPSAPPSNLTAEADLDLVALLERTPIPGGDAEAPAPERAPATPAQGVPRLVVLWREGARTEVARLLSAEMPGVRVEAQARMSRTTLEKEPLVAAVLGSPSELRALGLTPALRAAGREERSFVAASLDNPPSRAKLVSAPVGVLDELGPGATGPFLSRLLGADRLPPARRVGKVEDLISLLQLGVVETVVVESAVVARLRERTQRKVHTLDLESSPRPLAVAFLGGEDRVAPLRNAFGALSERAQRALGVSSWTE